MQVILNKPSIYEYKGVVLKSGVNTLTVEQQAILFPKNGIGVRPDVDNGTIEVIETKRTSAKASE